MFRIVILSSLVILLPLLGRGRVIHMSATELLSAGNPNGNAEVISMGGASVLQVKYPAGSSNPSSGTPGGYNFDASPPSIFPADEAFVAYQVKFSDNFAWVKGGKLPGLKIGKGPASDGHHSPDSASFRISWKAGGEVVPHIYPPSGVEQDPAWSSVGGKTGLRTGDHLWRQEFHLQKTSWNQIVVYAKLNSISNGQPVADGVLRLTVNGMTREYDKMIWRSRDDIQIETLVFSTYFGGNWSTPKTVYSYFKNFRVAKRLSRAKLNSINQGDYSSTMTSSSAQTVLPDDELDCDTSSVGSSNSPADSSDDEHYDCGCEEYY